MLSRATESSPAVASNWRRSGPGISHDDAAESRRRLEKLAALEFEVACLVHGQPIRRESRAVFRELVLGEPRR